MTDHVDEFESIFKRAAKDVFLYQRPAIESAVLVTDMDSAPSAALLQRVQKFLAVLESECTCWNVLSDSDYDRKSALLERLDALNPQLIVTYRHLKQVDRETHSSLGVYVDTLHLQELSRDINSQLDTKFVKLEASIRSADQRIEQLERLMRAAGDQPAVDMLVSDETSQSEPPQPSPMEETDPRKQRIYELADAGKTPLQIAQETGGGTGEIELILSLRGTSGGSG